MDDVISFLVAIAFGMIAVDTLGEQAADEQHNERITHDDSTVVIHSK